jgi:hypothetical protein
MEESFGLGWIDGQHEHVRFNRLNDLTSICPDSRTRYIDPLILYESIGDLPG